MSSDPKLYESLRDAGIPEHLHGGIVRYVQHGIMPGGFLCACIEMDGLKALQRAADQATKEAIPKITTWLLTEAPIECCGSPELVKRWIADKAKQRHDSRYKAVQP